MSAAATKAALQRELGVQDLGQLFEWIDLEQPLGSASISQVGGEEGAVVAGMEAEEQVEGEAEEEEWVAVHVESGGWGSRGV